MYTPLPIPGALAPGSFGGVQMTPPPQIGLPAQNIPQIGKGGRLGGLANGFNMGMQNFGGMLGGNAAGLDALQQRALAARALSGVLGAYGAGAPDWLSRGLGSVDQVVQQSYARHSDKQRIEESKKQHAEELAQRKEIADREAQRREQETALARDQAEMRNIEQRTDNLRQEKALALQEKLGLAGLGMEKERLGLGYAQMGQNTMLQDVDNRRLQQNSKNSLVIAVETANTDLANQGADYRLVIENGEVVKKPVAGFQSSGPGKKPASSVYFGQ